jgi:hypothetical protein
MESTPLLLAIGLVVAIVAAIIQGMTRPGSG